MIFYAKEVRGLPVVKLQQRLISLGYNCGASGADGNYGKNTSSAVIKFQRINGLKTDGIAGPATLQKLYSDSAKKNDGSAEHPYLSNNSYIWNIT